MLTNHLHPLQRRYGSDIGIALHRGCILLPLQRKFPLTGNCQMAQGNAHVDAVHPAKGHAFERPLNDLIHMELLPVMEEMPRL